MKKQKIEFLLIIMINLFLIGCFDVLSEKETDDFGKPVNLRATTGNGQAKLIWDHSEAYAYYELIVNHIHNCVDINSETCTPFYRGDSPSEKGGTVIESVEPPYIVGGLTNGLTYVFSIIGYDNNENSSDSLGDVIVSPLEGL